MTGQPLHLSADVIIDLQRMATL